MTDVIVSGLMLEPHGGRRLVEDAHFTLAKGEITLLIGPSAGGKSSIAYALCGLLDPAAWTIGGTITTGEGTTALSAGDRSLAALVFQSSGLLDDLSALDNIRIARDHGAPDIRLPDTALALLRAIDPEVAPSDASGGMRQRVAIVRALATGREVLILDEPNSGLDPDNAAILAESLRTISRDVGTSVLIIAHHVEGLLPLCSKVLVLDPGARRLIEISNDPEAVAREMTRIAGDTTGPGDFRWAERLASEPPPAWSGRAILRNLVLLGLNPLTILYIALGGAITGATSMLLAFNYRSVGRYLVPLLHDEILGRVAVVEFSIAVPLITSLLLGCRNNAVLTARLRLLGATGQRDAMDNLGLSVSRFIIAPVLVSSVILALVLAAAANVAAAGASLLAWSFVFPDQPVQVWREGFFSPYVEGDRMLIDIVTTTVKVAASAVLGAAAALHFGLARDRDPGRAQSAISDSIIAGALATLLINAAVTLFVISKLMIS